MEQEENGVVRKRVEGEVTTTTYYLKEMNADAIERYGLTKYLRKDVTSDEQGS